ncbi:MAG: TAXI family TRAP transporter solute-binding subunit [Nonomuraea sp.]|nr:TAXI family TRAP transporter solute-binding subunit [Nonomuraea sp.]NUP61466.1 TAXI family TRAP transporter solute-binding subunit [Nonomuraea sp.]NUP83431.1 TAXI family TRAP transporter solute-binding subunit [Nonomuraea sp.]NUR86447.1 TAXI family TRAP transporter solute-binding subunit [Nonomuraea sp.]NUS05689.1 TAXI family TRAP transporter solute-binding subunit [Nonomuraea sp.]
MSRRAFLGSALLAAGCSTTPPVELRLVTGLAGGPYGVLGDRLAGELRRDGLTVRVVETAASVQNLTMMADGRADVGFALADSADDAVRVRHQPVTALARMYMNYVHLVVRAGARIAAVDDLAGRSVSIGAEGSGTAVTATRVLSAAGLRTPPEVSRLGLDASITALRDGRIEAFFWSGGVPTPALAALGGIALVPLESLVPVLRRRYGPVYEHAAVPSGAYAGVRQVPTVGTPSYLMCRATLADDLAFTVTETLFRARDRLQAPSAPGGRLDKRYAIGTGVVALHPGAARYYRSVYG